ncbi:MAG: hypothetical protein NTW09_02815, partial [Candidatus Omnitrophica bacterium]|nr:hypothetical protein [Candidatus Omnitrophota bacterium]
LVLEDMEKLHKMYKPLYIGLTDSAMQPERLRQICGHNIDKGGKRKFSAFVRFEREFKSKKFCRLLAEGGLLGGQVGLESGSQRINDIINKGVKVDDANVILKNFYSAGMLMHLYCMVGAPGEAVKDAEMTYKFITLDWQIFSLYVLERGPLTRRAGEFGLTVRPLPDEFLAQAAEYDVKKGITQEESVALSIKYYEKLKCYMNPLNREMDVESFKVFAIIQKAKER